MHELEEQHLHPVGVETEHAGDRGVPARRRATIRAEHVDGAVEAAAELVDEIRDVGGAVRWRATAVAERISTQSCSSP